MITRPGRKHQANQQKYKRQFSKNHLILPAEIKKAQCTPLPPQSCHIRYV
jgi:hypothetical protein